VSQRSYNTNIASEYHVISALARLGYEVNLTLGNKKKVDIVVTLSDGTYRTIDVKSVAGKMDWLIGNADTVTANTHFYILVTYNGKFSELQITPQCFIIPASKMKEPFLKVAGNGKTRYVSRKFLFENGQHWFEKSEAIGKL
jgi:hypothetical protein